jgi:LysR family hydrogen peroxide-inducible transcriptional activator
MEIRQIVYFLALCEELHFTRAAKRCGVAQPSLTNAIRVLERELGAPLFHRKPRPHLSELGMAVKADLQSALAHLDRALARARSGPPQQRGMLLVPAAFELASPGAPRS